MNRSPEARDIETGACRRREVLLAGALTTVAAASPAPALAHVRPRTLLEFAGTPAPRMDAGRAALVVIDHQQEYVDGGVPLVGMRAAVDEIGALLRWARAAEVPVFHVLHNGAPGAALFAPGSRGAEVIASLAPVGRERVLTKHLPNAFAGTTLDDEIRSAGRDQLVLCGFATHMCLDATARAALDRGYRSFVVASATSDRDLPDPLGGVVPAAQIKHAALAGLADRFATVAPTAASLTGPV